MDDREWLAEQFERQRPRLRASAQRMLGSAAEAEDAVQEAWLRLDRSDGVENLSAWLTTVVARICLNMLRSRRTRRESSIEHHAEEPSDVDLEQQALLGDSVGLALLVVLDALTPAERLAFVLHDVFDLSFDEIAPVVGRTTVATRQLASRARRRVRGAAVPESDATRQRRVVDAYLAATRTGDFQALLAVLAPDVVLRADGHAVPTGVPVLLRGAQAVAEGAMASAARARHTRPALVDGSPALVMAPEGSARVVLTFRFVDERIAEIAVIGSPDRLWQLDVVLDR